MNIKSAIISNEAEGNKSLQDKIKENFPEIDIVACCSFQSGADEILRRIKPELVFLEINATNNLGFDFLNQLDERLFDLIFVSNDTRLAAQAIQYNALGYIVEPIELIQLAQVLDNAIRNTLLKEEHQANSNTSSEPKNESPENKIGLPTADGLDFVKVHDIIRCEGSNKYTKVHLLNATSILCSYNVGKFKQLLVSYDFYLCHKSHLINMKHIDKYNKEGTLVMMDGAIVPVSVRKRSEFMEKVERL